MSVSSTGRATGETKIAPRVPIDAGDVSLAQNDSMDVSQQNGIGALYRFTDRLFRARSRSDACDAALDAIREALGCERASILLFDDSDSMRFIAWRGLSDGYRGAVDGHSPWTKDTKDPLPICIQDIDSAYLDDTLKATIKAEGIRALAFVPLFAKGDLIGKFMTYCDAPRAFTDAEIGLAVTIARQLGFSLERMRAGEQLLEAQAQLVSELLATQQLHKISTQLIQENEAEALNEKVLDAAVAIMRSDFASMQLFHPERGELRLLAYRGFNPAAAAFLGTGAAGIEQHLRCRLGDQAPIGCRRRRTERLHERLGRPRDLSPYRHPRRAVHAADLPRRPLAGDDLHALEPSPPAE